MEVLWETLQSSGWTVTNSVTAVLAMIGWLLFIWEREVRRTESKANQLTEILDPLIGAAQNLRLANRTRRKREDLSRSYPDPEKAPEAAYHADRMLQEYQSFLNAAAEDLRRFERCHGSRVFRLPRRLNKLLDDAKNTLSKAGDHVNAGKFDQTDVEIARVLDIYKTINEYIAGVSWKSRFSWVRKKQEKKLDKQQEAERKRFDLSENEVREVLDLINKRITTQAPNTFVVHPPKKLIDNPSIAQADNVLDELEDSIFSVVFQDGTSAMIGLPQLMMLVHQLIMLQHHMSQMTKSFEVLDQKPDSVQLSVSFTEKHLMSPEMVKLLLSKIEFSKSPSDAPE